MLHRATDLLILLRALRRRARSGTLSLLYSIPNEMKILLEMAQGVRGVRSKRMFGVLWHRLTMWVVPRRRLVDLPVQVAAVLIIIRLDRTCTLECR